MRRINHDQFRDVGGTVTHEIYTIRINSASLMLEFMTLQSAEFDIGISICLGTLWIDTLLFRIGWGLL